MTFVRLFLLGVLVLLQACSERLPFEKNQWRAARQGNQYESTIRHRMADDLVASRALLGKSRAEVVDLLGEVTITDKWSDWDMAYLLGLERGFGAIDSEWLVLRLERDRVIDAKVTRD